MRFSWFFRVTREWCNKLLSPASNWVIDCMKKSQKTCVIIYFCGVTLLFRWLISRILAMALNCSVLYGSIFSEVHHTFITAQSPSCTKNPPPNNTPWLMLPPTGALVVQCLGARVCIGSLPAAVCWGLGDPLLGLSALLLVGGAIASAVILFGLLCSGNLSWLWKLSSKTAFWL